MENNLKDLQNGVVLAELGGYTNGEFCAIHGKGATLVMLGTYIVDNSDFVDYSKDFVFKSGENNYYSYLKENIVKAKESNAKVGVSVVSTNISDTIDFLLASQKAGADYASFCAHSTMKMFINNDTSSALLLRKNWEKLKKSIRKILREIEIPVIFKIGAFDNPDVFDAIEIIKDEGIPIIHINVKSKNKDLKGMNFLRNINKENIFIIAGGGIKDINSASRMLDTGINAISIGSAAIKNPDICGHIQKLIRQTTLKLSSNTISTWKD